MSHYFLRRLALHDSGIYITILEALLYIAVLIFVVAQTVVFQFKAKTFIRVKIKI